MLGWQPLRVQMKMAILDLRVNSVALMPEAAVVPLNNKYSGYEFSNSFINEVSHICLHLRCLNQSKINQYRNNKCSNAISNIQTTYQSKYTVQRKTCGRFLNLSSSNIIS